MSINQLLPSHAILMQLMDKVKDKCPNFHCSSIDSPQLKSFKFLYIQQGVLSGDLPSDSPHIEPIANHLKVIADISLTLSALNQTKTSSLTGKFAQLSLERSFICSSWTNVMTSLCPSGLNFIRAYKIEEQPVIETVSRCSGSVTVFPNLYLIVSQDLSDRTMLIRYLQTISAAFDRDDWIFDNVEKHENAKVVVPIVIRHFAHSIWNELSGLEALLDSNIYTQLGKFWEIWICMAPFGNLERIFPEFSKRIRQFQSLKELLKVAKDENIKLCSVTSKYVNSGLVARLQAVAKASVSEEINRWVIENKEKRRRIVLLSVRSLPSKSLVNQVEFLSKLINILRKVDPEICFVFDGFSISVNEVIGTLASDAIMQCSININSIVLNSEFDDASRYISLNGLSHLDVIAVASVVDFYVCNAGSQAHKIEWFSQCPGYLHAPRQWLDMSKSLRMADIQGAQKCCSQNLCFDIVDDQNELRNKNNYMLNIDEVINDVVNWYSINTLKLSSLNQL